MPSLGMTHIQPRQALWLFIATKQCCWSRYAANALGAYIWMRLVRHSLDKNHHHTLLSGDQEDWRGHLWGCTQATQGFWGPVRRLGLPV